MTAGFALTPHPVPDAALAAAWRQAAVAAPVFLRWDWMASLLDRTLEGAELWLLRHNGRPLALLGRRAVRRHGVLIVSRWYLNETGDRSADAIALEYNGFLDPALSLPAFRWLLCHLPAADELVVRCAVPVAASALTEAAAGAGWGLRCLKRQPAPYVDLAALRQSGKAYADGLGRNTRAAVRRSRKLYRAAYGEPVLRAARSVEEAHAYFSRLQYLHTAQWRCRGMPGAFGHAGFEGFHRRMIDRAHSHGGVRLYRIAAGRQEIGYLYALAADGRVSIYLTGFAPPPDNRWKPGYLCHALAVQACLDGGDQAYDFLAGDQAYKNRLADRAELMTSLVAFAPKAALRLEDWMRRAYNGGRRLVLKRGGDPHG